VTFPLRVHSMNHSGNPNDSISDFLSRVFPQLYPEPGSTSVLENLKGDILIPLYLHSPIPGIARLALEGRVLLGDADRVAIPGGYYRIIVSETYQSARSVQAGIRLSGNGEYSTMGTLPGGEGVTLVKLARIPGMAQSKSSIHFDGCDGDVFIEVHDERFEMSRENKIHLSIVMSRADGNRYLLDREQRTVDHYKRAQAISKSLETAVTDDVTLMLLQSLLEKRLGSRIAVATVSPQDVIEHIEEIMSHMEVEIPTPTAREIRPVIDSYLSNIWIESSALAKDVAHRYIRNAWGVK